MHGQERLEAACEAEYAASQVIVRVYDWGSDTWDAPSQNPGAGFGVPLTEQLADDVRRSTEGGVKMVELRFALTPGYETYKGLGWYGVLLQESNWTSTQK